MYQYRVCGLNLQSEFHFPELSPTSFGCDETDVSITYSVAVPEALEGQVLSMPGFDSNNSTALLRIPEVGRFLIEKGCRISVQPHAVVESRTLRLYLLGSCIGAVLHQRGMIPMHGSAVSRGAGAMIICGRSGAGKSTTAAAMSARGYTILADDISALNVDNNSGVTVASGYPQLKLGVMSLEYLGLPSQLYEWLPQGQGKYAVKVLDHFETVCKPVLALVYLEGQNVDAPDLQVLKGNQKFHAIRENIYAKKFNPAGMSQRFFSHCRQLANSIVVFKLVRPINSNSVDAVADLIEQCEVSLVQEAAGY